MNPHEKPTAGALGLREEGDRGVRQARARRGVVNVPGRALGGSRRHIDDIESPIQTAKFAEVAVPMDAHRIDAGALEALSEEGVLLAELVEVTPVSMGLAAILADKHRTDALAGIGGERVGALEDGGASGE